MVRIEIRHLSGAREQRGLSKTEPLSIGSHPSNDVCIDEAGIGVVHCRIAWNGDGYEIAAGGHEGVDLNGTLVHHARLREGDVLRIGSVDIAFHEDGLSGEDENEVGLQAVTDDEMEVPRRSVDAARPAGAYPEPDASGSPREADASGRPAPARSQPAPSAREPEAFDDEQADDFFEFSDEIPRPARRPEPRDWQDDRPALRRLWDRMKGEPVRPGEQDILRSPVVLGLTGGAMALLLAAATVWFLIARQTVQKHYDAALEALEEGNYRQAEELFEGFIAEYPRHEYSEAAHYGLGKARIERRLASATPDWAEALTQVNAFIEKNRDRPHFSQQKPALRGYAERIANGAVRAAERGAGNLKVATLRDLLELSRSAAALVGRLAPPDEPPVEFDKRFAELSWKAERAIEKRETFLQSIDKVAGAIEDGRPIAALKIREELLAQYDDFRSHPELERLLEATLDLEKDVVKREKTDRDALTDERKRPVPRPLTLSHHVRSVTSQDPSGRTVVAVAKDCCYGIDTVTGDPVWRRVIGLETPFFPIDVETSVAGLLVFDTNFRELVLLDRLTGQLVWRQPLQADVSGRPLVHEGEVYLPTLDGNLYRILLETGRVTARVEFPRRVLAPPVLVADGKELVLAAEELLLYTLLLESGPPPRDGSTSPRDGPLRPLECRTVSYSGHREGTVDAPLLSMGPLVLLTENDRMDASLVRVFDTRGEGGRLIELARDRVQGHIYQQPVIRGRQLFVASTPERITAFAVSDDPDRDALTRLAETKVLSGHSGPLYLKAGADGQLWMAGSAFRRFQLRTDAISYDEARKAAVGQTTQPLQLVDRYFYLGRRQKHHRAVIFTPVERERMTSHWKTVLGSSILAWMTPSPDTIVCITETGDVFRINAAELQAGGFRHGAVELFGPGDEPPSTELFVSPLGGERLAVATGTPRPRLWIIGARGRISREVALQAPLEAEPVVLEAGIVLPMPGRLKLLPEGAESSSVEDYLAPVEKDGPARWRFVAAVDGNELIALDSRGELARIRYRPAPVPHLQEVRRTSLPDPVDVAPAVRGQLLAICDAAPRLQLIDLATMERLAERKLDEPATASPRFVGDRLYLETGRQNLECYTFDEGLERRWTVPFEGGPLASPPLLDGELLLVAGQNGDVWALDPDTGEVQARLNLRQPLTDGPTPVGGLIVVPSIDGSLNRIESLRADRKATGGREASGRRQPAGGAHPEADASGSPREADASGSPMDADASGGQSDVARKGE